MTCGYIMEADKLHDVCPACGVPAGAFNPYEPLLTKSRSRLLELHLHPIIVHFPQAIVVLALLLLILLNFTSGELYDAIFTIAQFNLLLLPLSVLGGALTGMFDGKVRFKSITTPVLVFKIGLSFIFLVTTLVPLFLIFFVDVTSSVIMIMLLCIVIASACAVLLGKAGAPLIHAVFPG